MIDFRPLSSVSTAPSPPGEHSEASKPASGRASPAFLGKAGLGGSFSEVLAQLKEAAHEIEHSKKKAFEKVYELARDGARASRAEVRHKKPPEPVIVGKNGALTDVPLLPAVETPAGKEIRKHLLDRVLDKDSPPKPPRPINPQISPNQAMQSQSAMLDGIDHAPTRTTLDVLGDRLKTSPSQKQGLDDDSWWQNAGGGLERYEPMLEEAMRHILACLERNKAGAKATDSPEPEAEAVDNYNEDQVAEPVMA